MNGIRSTPIIAVFGSDVDSTLGPAEALGAAITGAGHVLLTGGGCDQDAKLVKERAMRGAHGAGAAARVGVLGKEAGSEVSFREEEPRFAVLRLGYGDRRNYVEACMCDVAVAFGGGPGTKSEVAFALALARPVVLLGGSWATEFPVVREPGAFEAFVTLAKGRADAEGSETIDQLICRAYEKLDPGTDQVVDNFPVDRPVEAVAELVAHRARDADYPGHFPDLPERASVAADYRRWLAGVARA